MRVLVYCRIEYLQSGTYRGVVDSRRLDEMRMNVKGMRRLVINGNGMHQTSLLLFLLELLFRISKLHVYL